MSGMVSCFFDAPRKNLEPYVLKSSLSGSILFLLHLHLSGIFCLFSLCFSYITAVLTRGLTAEGSSALSQVVPSVLEELLRIINHFNYRQLLCNHTQSRYTEKSDILPAVGYRMIQNHSQSFISLLFPTMKAEEQNDHSC